MKKTLVFIFLIIFLACSKKFERKVPSLDIAEIPTSEINLSIPEIENLFQANVSNLSLNLGSIENLKEIKFLSKIPQNIHLKILIPSEKIILFKDPNFVSNTFKKIETQIVKALSQQNKITSILFVFEGKEFPRDLNYFEKFLEKFKPLNLSIGIGLPLFWQKEIKREQLKYFDYAVIFARGFPYPFSLNQELLSTYRTNTKERGIIDFPIPFYFGLSFLNGAWITSSKGIENYIEGIPFNAITESPNFEFLGVNLNPETQSPQYSFEIKKDIDFEKFSMKKGNNLTIILFGYNLIKRDLGKQSKYLNPNYLGRYYYYYSVEEVGGVFNFNTWISYLKAQIFQPNFNLEITYEKGGYVLKLSNASALYSDYSEEKNYLEWEFKENYFKEASGGNFSRFRFLSKEDIVLTPQADKVRFYEKYIAPYEVLETGPIKVAGELKGIFRVSYVLPGGELKTEVLQIK